MNFIGKTAAVVGGGGSIGGAVCALLAEKGASVAVCDCNLAGAETVARKIGERARAFSVDARDYNSILSLKEQIGRALGSVDIFIYTSGGSARQRMAPLVSLSIEVIDEIIGVNLMGAIYCAKAFLPDMLERKSGKIVFTGSIQATNGGVRHTEYAASKGGVIAMTHALAKEVAPHGINVNCVSPGLVPRDEDAEALERLKSTNYTGRVCMPDDVARLMVFLASDEADMIVGQNYVIDGGRCLANKGDK